MNEQMLKKWHEAVGKLTGVKDEGYAITLEFTAVWQVQVPRMSNDVVKNLNGLIGKRIGVLRTDIPSKQVLIREIKTKNERVETYE